MIECNNYVFLNDLVNFTKKYRFFEKSIGFLKKYRF